MKRYLCLVILTLMVLALTACNGTISSIGVPASSPWNRFSTFLTSSYDDLTVVTTGSNITSELSLLGPVPLCDSDQGRFIGECHDSNCGLTQCEDTAPEGATNVSFIELHYLYALIMTLDRPAFTAGGIELESATVGTLGAIGLTVSSESGLSVGAGFTEGLFPTSSEPSNFDDGGLLLMTPQWADFAPGWVCADGTSTGCDPEAGMENVVAGCSKSDLGDGGDQFAFRVDAAPGTYSMTCGSVPVTLTLTAPNTYESAGDCIDTLKAERCAGLRGQDRAACNHAQVGICHATFNIPSAHNN